MSRDISDWICPMEICESCAGSRSSDGEDKSDIDESQCREGRCLRLRTILIKASTGDATIHGAMKIQGKHHFIICACSAVVSSDDDDDTTRVHTVSEWIDNNG